jgi:hypothetical protein
MLAYFVRYLYGNVLIKTCYSNDEIAVPRYCRKFMAKSIDILSEEWKRAFLYI